MPELPEVHTTATMLNELLPGARILDVWTDYKSGFHAGKENIKNPAYFTEFRKMIIGRTIQSVSRRGKNVLIHLSGNLTVLVHMKMTGHLLYGTYEKKDSSWKAVAPETLKDPFSRHIHLVFVFSNGRHLALSDSRKFANVFVAETKDDLTIPHLSHIGPEPLHKNFSLTDFKVRLLLRPRGKIKTVLMDQEIIAGIGNIYSDEILWVAGVHPEEPVKNIPDPLLKKMYSTMKEILAKGIDFGGDSTSDYRNPRGERGAFQYQHHAYRNTGKKCSKPGCPGFILRKVVGGRSAHFCSVHQKHLKK